MHHGHRVAVEQLGIGLDQGQGDPAFPHGRVVAAGHVPDAGRRPRRQPRRAAAGDRRPPDRAAADDGPVARSSSSAAPAEKSPLSQPTTQPSPAWSGVMPGPSSWPCSGRPASRRRVSRAPSPAGVTPGRQRRGPEAPGRLDRDGTLDAVLARCSRYPATRQVTPSHSKRRHAEIGAPRPPLRDDRRQASARASGPLHGDDGPGTRWCRLRRWPRPPGWCSRRWA